MKNKRNSYYSSRQQLEKTQQQTWKLIIIARLLFLFAALVSCYLKS